MQFFSPESFLFFWMLPLLAGIFVISYKLWHHRLKRFGNPQTLRSKLMPGYRSSAPQIQIFYVFLVFIFAIMALARPQWGEEKKKIERKGVNLVFLLDTSLSTLADDVKPNRLEKSKIEIKTFIRRLKGDRVGMVTFAGSSFLQTPLTLDYAAFLLFLDAVKVGYIPDPGTSLDRAMRLAIQSFPANEPKHRAVVLLTDGEDHEGGIEQALEEAKKSGVRIYAIGVGTAEGGPIPLKDEQGRKNGFKKDQEGQVVITKLNRPLLEKIAADTGGLYLPSTPSEQEVEVVLKHLESLGQRQFKERLVAEKEDHFQFFVFWALLFLVLEMLVKHAKKMPVQPLVIAAAFMLFTGFLESPRDLNEKGNQLYHDKKYKSAVDAYRKAQVRKPEDPSILYNLGTTLYQTDDFQEAAGTLEKSLKQSNAAPPDVRAKAYYNYGNVQYRLGNFDKAIESYQKVLEINPKDNDAKYNLEFLQKEKSLFEKKDQEKKKNEQKNQQQNQQQSQQQNQQQQQQQEQQQNQNQEQNQQQQNQQGEQEGQEDQEKQDDQESQSEKEKQEQEQEKQQEEQQKKEQEESQAEKQKEQEQDQEQEQKPETEEEQKEQPREGEEQGKAPKPLQGQMTLENALRILDALKDSEKELQDLRRPPIEDKPSHVAKDW